MTNEIEPEMLSKDRADSLNNLRQLIPIVEMMLKPERAMDVILQLVRDILDHESGVLFLVDSETGKLKTISVYGDFIDMAGSIPFSSGHGLSSWVVKEKKPILLSEVHRRKERPDDPIRSFMSIPIIDSDEVLGVMNFGHSRPGAFDKNALTAVIEATNPLSSLIRSLKQVQSVETGPVENEQVEQERLSAVQQTVVSLNHEINNPLASMILAVELLSRSVEDEDDKMKSQLGVVKKEAERIAEFVKSLGQIQTIAVKDYIPGVVQMLDIQESIKGQQKS